MTRILLSTILLTAALQAATVPTIRATGEGRYQARPDQARIDIGVQTQAPSAQEAGALNAKRTAEVLAELKKVAGAGADIKTVNYSVSPNYRYDRQGGAPTIIGYNANNTVQLTTPDLAAVSKVIDTSTKAGANNIHGIQFMLKDEQAARAEALKTATQAGRANAEAIASALGTKIVRLVSAETGQPAVIRPMMAEMMQAKAAMADAPPTPVEPGTLDIRATVTLTFEVAQ